VDLYYEGSVAGGIPIIRTLKVGFAPNRITDVLGIINGTTNYILTQMDAHGRPYHAALAEAQAHGYAEANPKNDVDGFDAAYKLAILAAIAFQARLRVQDVYCEGIRRLEAVDFEFARKLGYTIKLLAHAGQSKKGISLKVHPALVDRRHPLANVNGVFNAVFIRGDFIGDAMLYGRGAGSEPTGAAVVSDVLDIVHSFRQDVTRRNLVTGYRRLPLISRGATQARFYLRFEVQDRPGVLSKITHLLGKNHISVATIEQQTLNRKRAMLVVVTHAALEKHMDAALLSIKRLSDVHACAARIRVQ
jgi:homoserine dehydrogenase